MGLVTTKIIAFYIGPSGIAIIGQMTNALNILIPFSNGGIGNGIIKYIAEYGALSVKGKIEKLINTILGITLLSSILIAVLLGLFNKPISSFLFGDTGYTWFFIILSISMPMIAFGYTLLCIINGFKRIKHYALIGASNSLISAALAYVLIIPFGLNGALISLVVTNLTLFLLSTYFFLSIDKTIRISIKLDIDREIVKKLSNFAVMGLVSAAVVPISHIVIRTFIMNHFSVDDAGYWQGLNRLSDAYLSVILLPLSVYYLPRLSEIHNFSVLKKELSSTFLFSVSLAVIASALVYLFRDWIILILFTSDFREMRILFPYQLIGNVIKVGSWTIAMLMWAKSMTRLFIFTEIFFSSTLIIFSIYFLKNQTLVGVTHAYLLNQVLYFLFLINYFRRNIRDIM